MDQRRVLTAISGVAFVVASSLGFVLPETVQAQWVVLHGKNGSAARNIPAEPLKALIETARKGAEIKCIAFAPNGGWVMLFAKNGFASRNIPAQALRTLIEQQKKGTEFKSLSFSPNGGWALFTSTGFFALDIGEDPFQKLNELLKQRQLLKSISFTPTGGWIILSDRNSYFAHDVPVELLQELDELGTNKSEFKSIVFAPNGGWAVLYDKNRVATGQNFPEEPLKSIDALRKKGRPLKSVSFLTTSFVSLSQDEQETRDEVMWRMNRADVPGLGIALVNNGKLEWARGYGVLRAKEEQPVTEHTRFQAGSISQLVTALAALRLVQQDAIGLDRPLNDKLASWKIPENEHTRERQPTLRHVLSHSGGFNVPAVVFAPKSSFTLLDVLEGKAETPAIQIEFVPGSKVDVSAGGFLVVQQLLIDAAGKPFPELVQELVFGPVGMQESTMEHPLPKEWEAVSAVGHLADQQPLEGRWGNYSPNLAAAGLWSTPTDLARLIAALSAAHQSKPDAILAPKLCKEMFTRQVGDMGLGAALGGKGKSLSFSVRGANSGYTSYMIAFPAAGQGAVLMTNSDTGERLINELVESLRLEYGWPE
jgi:CubicO group peptidase (beta-lactamase class C family)